MISYHLGASSSIHLNQPASLCRNIESLLYIKPGNVFLCCLLDYEFASRDTLHACGNPKNHFGAASNKE